MPIIWLEQFWPLPERPEGFNDIELWNDLQELERDHRRFLFWNCFMVPVGIVGLNAIAITLIAFFA